MMRKQTLGRSKQNGMSFLGLVYVLITAAIALLVGLKLYPLYMEYFKIGRAVESVVQQADAPRMSKRDLIVSLVRRLDIDGERRISERNAKDYLTIQKNRDTVTITAEWRGEATLVGNLSLAAEFRVEASN